MRLPRQHRGMHLVRPMFASVLLILASAANAQPSLQPGGVIQKELASPSPASKSPGSRIIRGTIRGPLINTDAISAPAFEHRFEGGVRTPTCASESRDGEACTETQEAGTVGAKPAAPTLLLPGSATNQ